MLDAEPFRANDAAAFNTEGLNDVVTLKADQAKIQFLPVMITSDLPEGFRGVSASMTGSESDTADTMTVTLTSGMPTGLCTGHAKGRSANAAVTDAPVLGVGVLGAFGAAVAGALL